MDAGVKEDFESVCKDMGLNLDAAFNVFAKKVINERRIPFELCAPEYDPFYSEENMARLHRSIGQLNEGRGQIHEVLHDKSMVG
ncbi:MAG: type II toxin-antitoxin system RelB/DinJ family antitoxin [Selenomonadaceae bacterium]|nr:type II toxin-antitoxin system RelB/DinJ family antitoxin [Selenomonadaceae bacterium]